MADTVTANSRPSAPLPNRYLEGAYAPVAEEVTLTDLVVTGTLPPELDGRYLRNGPNPLGPVDPATYHWFTGDAMVHGLRLRDGRAEWYRNRWVRSTNVSEAFGEPPAPGELLPQEFNRRRHRTHLRRSPRQSSDPAAMFC